MFRTSIATDSNRAIASFFCILFRPRLLIRGSDEAAAAAKKEFSHNISFSSRYLAPFAAISPRLSDERPRHGPKWCGRLVKKWFCAMRAERGYDVGRRDKKYGKCNWSGADGDMEVLILFLIFLFRLYLE